MPIIWGMVAGGAVFLTLDLVWLGIIARDFYRSQMATILAQPFQAAPAVAFYALYLVGVAAFVVAPALAGGGWLSAMWKGALFGLVAYGTYDLTGLAVIRDFPTSLAFVDMAWGAVLTATASTVAVLVALRFV